MRDETPDLEPAGTTTWQRKMDRDLAATLDKPDFDLRFVRRLLALLDQARFHNLAHAILATTMDMARGKEDREELDALVDLAIQLMAREDRVFATALSDDD